MATAPLTRRADTTRRFEAIADAIIYRWSVERDTWVSAAEVEEARAYLERAGICIAKLADGRFVVQGETADTLGEARVVLLGLRHLLATRRGAPPPSPPAAVEPARRSRN